MNPEDWMDMSPRSYLALKEENAKMKDRIRTLERLLDEAEGSSTNNEFDAMKAEEEVKSIKKDLAKIIVWHRESFSCVEPLLENAFLEDVLDIARNAKVTP